jgi:hypothetical protein
MKKVRRIRRSEATWRELFSRQGASGMNISEFCQREGINHNVFRRWRVALLGSGAPRTATPVAAQPPPASFIDLGPLAQSSARWEVRLDLGQGMVLSLARG